jgi:hypothetical protein
MTTFKSPYVYCPGCGAAIHDPEERLQDPNQPCPDCDSTGEPRNPWPVGPEVHIFLGIVHDQKVDQGEQRAVAVVFLATVLEALLEDYLWQLLEAHGASHKISRLLLDAYRGRDKRVALYKELADRPLREALTEASMDSFLADWKKLADDRNVTVHGDLKGYFSDSSVICRLRDNCLHAFAVVDAEVRRMVKTLEGGG